MSQPRPRVIPPPADIGAKPRVLVPELADLVGQHECAEVCARLLQGEDPLLFEEELYYLGGPPAPALIAGDWSPYWGRVWGARGLLYVWDPTAGPSVVAGLADPHWRVAEMCLKVAALRELAEAADAATALTHHELTRVRANAVRTLGLVGDTEHVEAVLLARDDPERQVRRAAGLALERLAGRLDLTW